MSRHVQIVERFDDAGPKAVEKLADREAVPAERHNRIDGQLAGAVHQAAAAAVDPADLDLPVPHQIALHGHLARRAATADGNQRAGVRRAAA